MEHSPPVETAGSSRRTTPALSTFPRPDLRLTGDHGKDSAALERHLAAGEAQLAGLPPRGDRTPAQERAAEQTRRAGRAARHAFLTRHAVRVYDELTAGRTRSPSLDDLAHAAAERYPGLVPGRALMAAENRLPQEDKSGHEIDQGILFAHLLADPATGEHLLDATLRPTPEAYARLDAFVRTGHADLGRAVIDRRAGVAHVTIRNDRYLNAEDDAVVQALETAVDLALLDDQVAVGVLRGGTLTKPRYAGRRVFGSGINLTHLFAGRISFLGFMLRRELGYIRKLTHGLRREDPGAHPFTASAGKPWVGAVDTFAIGGAAQVALVLDRVVADDEAYFTLPALREGIIPGAAGLRLTHLLGSRRSRRMIFFDERVDAATPAGALLCDETVPPDRLDGAVDDAAVRLADPAVPSNRRMFQLALEPDDRFRRYLSHYAWEQAHRLHSPHVIAKLQETWVRRRTSWTD
ncbi:enoyl-CoA hydratase/isomerase family protein [Streptomyces sp. XM4011]|uniref:enoyl-CoA hydratase/isomerase family protein n=1 Tax=Streptomyces TaxID=1883 RepID=UPI001FF76F25|nr:enoyl-CoA hydratase/isomerase family protein [Streptomyces sp. XM4011]MCK1816665.1 enoyl-CoA hydratase/isomerase family protein [Streptomyces sp. XM4011]